MSLLLEDLKKLDNPYKTILCRNKEEWVECNKICPLTDWDPAFNNYGKENRYADGFAFDINKMEFCNSKYYRDRGGIVIEASDFIAANTPVMEPLIHY